MSLWSRIRNASFGRLSGYFSRPPADAPWGKPDFALLILWVTGAASALAIKQTQLFIGFDGGTVRELARRQFEWGVPVLSTSFDLYQGLGDVFASGANFTLLPSFIVGSWFGVGALGKVATYTVALTEYSLSIVLFARALGLPRTQSVIAAVGLPLLTFPLDGTGAVYGVLALIPQLASAISATLLICMALIQFGRQSRLRDIGSAAIFAGLMLWTAHSGIALLVLSGPMLTLTFISSLLVSEDWQERWKKLALVAGTGILCSGALAYLLGLLLNSAPVTAPTELNDDRTVITFASILFHWNSVGPAGPILVIVAMLGAFLAACDPSRPRLRVFAITLLTYFLTRIAFWTTTVLVDFWRGPSALYFEFFVLPLYAIYAVFFFVRIAEFWPRLFSVWPVSVPPRAAVVCAAVATALTLATATRSSDWGFAYPPSSTVFIPIMQAETKMVPPAPFRGRVINMTGRKIDHGVTWIDLHTNDRAIAREFGNEMRLVGLHHFSIPGFFQYGSTMTPAFYALTSRLLSDLRDKQLRSVSVLRRYDPARLALLGVRFVITDAPIAGATLVSETEADQTSLYLYRVPDTNVGDYSPTEVHAATNATEALVKLGRSHFNPRRELIGDVPGGSAGLVPLKDSSVSFDGVSLRVTASSEGRSVLLLPLEYSRCINVTTRAGDPELFRADLVLTGLVFSGRVDATLALRNGPFVNPTCRLRDLADLLDFGIRDVPLDVRK